MLIGLLYMESSTYKCMYLLGQCRQAKISYDGKFMVDVSFQYGDGAPVREKFHFGQLPIMLKVTNSVSLVFTL